MDCRSEVAAWRLWSWKRAWGIGVGSVRRRAERRERRSEIISGSVGGERGEVRGCVRVRRVRVQVLRWVVRAVWVVIRLVRGVSYRSGDESAEVAYRVVPFSIPDCEGSSISESATRLATLSVSLPFASVPRRARLSIAAMRASNEGEMPSAFSKSLSSP